MRSRTYALFIAFLLLPLFNTAAAAQDATPVLPDAPATAAEDSFSVDEAVYDLQLSAYTCGDDARVGQYQLQAYEDGAIFTSAETREQCQLIEALFTVTLTNVNGDSAFVYEEDNAGIGPVSFPEVEAGTYLISWTSDHPEIDSGTASEQLVVIDDNAIVEILFFVAKVPVVGVPSGETEDVLVSYISCHSPERAGEVDFELFSTFNVASINNCDEDVPGIGAITIEGMTLENTPYGPETREFDETFNNLPAGTYTVTESIYGTTSEQMTFVDSNILYVFYYYDDQPPSGFDMTAIVIVCSDPDRAGEIDYQLVDTTGFIALSTCIEIPGYYMGSVPDVIISDETGEVFRQAGMEIPDALSIPPLPQGSYTFTLDGFEASDATELEINKQYALQMVVYVDDAIDIDPEIPDDQEADLFVAVGECVDPARAGDVEYMYSLGFFPADTNVCVADWNLGGYLYYQHFALPDGTNLLDSGVEPVFGGFLQPTLQTGYYKFGYSRVLGEEPSVWSEVLPVHEGNDAQLQILVYTGEARDTTTLGVRIDKCDNAALNGTTEFHLRAKPWDGGSSFVFAPFEEVTPCHVTTIIHGEYSVVLTNMDTGETFPVTQFTSFLNLFEIRGVPAGTYVVTELWDSNSQSSEPFEIDPANTYNMSIRNFEGLELPEPDYPSTLLTIVAYECLDDDLAGTSRFFHYPGLPLGEFPGPEFGESAFSANNVTITCFATSEHVFNLEGGPAAEAGEFGADALYGFVPALGRSHIFQPTSNGSTPTVIPNGQYVLTDTTTGTSTDPILLGSGLDTIAVYSFQANPTPTPTNTAVPTATSTDVPTATTGAIDPSATATGTAVDPTATSTAAPSATADASSTVAPSVTAEPSGTVEPTSSITAEPTTDDALTPTAGATVTDLPSTGSGGESTTGPLYLLLSGLAFAVGCFWVGTRRRLR